MRAERFGGSRLRGAARIERDDAEQRNAGETRVEHRERPPLAREAKREPRADERRQATRDRAADLIGERDRRITHVRGKHGADEARDHRREARHAH
ncbi:hypothetical protein M3616_22560, partial [Bacillus velezensis]|nr:hypothetical protein [Bacillus velezensis]